VTDLLACQEKLWHMKDDASRMIHDLKTGDRWSLVCVKI
jgi:hypothetical protein